MRIRSAILLCFVAISLLPAAYLGSLVPLFWLRNHTQVFKPTGPLYGILHTYAGPLRNSGEYSPPWLEREINDYKYWLVTL